MRNKEAWVSGLFLIFTLVVNGLGSGGYINGMSQKAVSDRYMTLITPNSGAFAIWGVIYGLLFISLAFMIFSKQDYYRKAVKEISFLFIVSSVFNMAWILAFSYLQLILSSILILAFLFTLTSICRRLAGIHNRGRWLLPLTFGLYTGWVFIASVVNISATLVKWNFSGWGLSESIWASLTLVVALILVAFVVYKIRNAALSLPIAWAFYGITVALDTAGRLTGLLSITLYVGMAFLLALAVLVFILNRRSFYPVDAFASK